MCNSKSSWATRLPIFSACIALFCFYAPYDYDLMCVRKSWCYRSLQIRSTSFLNLWKFICSHLNWHLLVEGKSKKSIFFCSKSLRIWFIAFSLMVRVSIQAAPKNFLQLQKLCSKHLGASTTSGLSNAHRIVVIGCVGKKERNESKNCWSTADFKHFEQKMDFVPFRYS